MAYIQPNSTILLLHNIPLEPDYEHTLYTASASAQYTAFASFTKYTLAANTYQRVNKNTCRVGIVADNLYDCNYMLFQNTNFGSKWFYAFITKVEYINNECTEVEYQLDVMQTYFHDFSLGYCFVEREHSEHDYLGENYIDEGIDYGELVYDGDLDDIDSLNRLAIFIAVASGQSRGKLVDNTFQGADIYMYALSSAASDETLIKNFLSQYTATPEDVLGIWTAPCYGVTVDENFRVTGFRSSKLIKTYATLSGTELFGSYTPKNKKLYMYPYNFVEVTNAMGADLKIRYEFSNGFTPRLMAYWNITQPVEVIARPYGYKGSTLDPGGVSNPRWGLFTDSLKISGYGIGCWSNETWVQQMNSALYNGIMGGLISTIGSPVDTARNYVPPVENGFSNIFMTLGKKNMTPHLTYGNANSGGAMAAMGILNFYGGRCRITEQYARTIDDYFTMYGYQTNRIKVPNTNSRPHWNYVKTGTCELISLTTMPADDAEKVKSCFNHGITLWKNMNEVGMFNLDNRPTT